MPKLQFLLFAFFIALSSNAQSNDTIRKPKIIKQEKSVEISIIQLIANPDKYHGKRVTIEGYLILEFEGTAIYLGRDDFEHRLNKNAVWLDFKADRTHPYHKEYMSITGVYNKKNNGHFGLYSGSLEDIGFGRWEN